jgi:hypothetical protein
VLLPKRCIFIKNIKIIQPVITESPYEIERGKPMPSKNHNGFPIKFGEHGFCE